MDDLARAVVGRPWLTLVLDVFSRCVLGFYLSFDAPSAAGVALAVGQAVLAKPDWLGERGLDLAWPMHGIPRSLHLDNGKEFHSKALRRSRVQSCSDPDSIPLSTRGVTTRLSLQPNSI